MFNETLVESSPALRRRRHWPTFAAFALQIAVAAALLVIPLFYVGAIPLAQRVRLATPVTVTPVVQTQATTSPAGGGGGGHPVPQQVILLASNSSHPVLFPSRTDGPPEPPTDFNLPGDPRLPPGVSGPGNGPGSGSNVRLDDEKKRIKRSTLDEGLLVSKIVPEYPIIAKRVGVQGDVKLHAIISRDGTIQSLNLISGHPLLVVAAMDAVKQWRYRPYYLNGEAVEVETYITVTFRKTI